MVVLHQLSASTIDRFLSATARFPTAAAYRAGVASYLFGVLARERSPESGLKAEQYREKFDEAAALLGHIDRPAADAICALVAFHYNQLSRAISRSSCPRVGFASARLADLLAGREVADLAASPPERSSLDYVLSDALTEQVLAWCCVPLGGSAAADVGAMEAALPRHEPFDQLKLRVIAAEHHLRTGRRDLARPHLNQLQNKPNTEPWVDRVRARLGEVR